MAGEQFVPGVDLRHYIERVIQHEHDLTEQRFTAVSEAVNKAERAMTMRLEGMNEFRRQLENQEARYVQKIELGGLLETINVRLSTLEKAGNIMTGKTTVLWVFIVAFLGLIAVVTKFFGNG